MSVSCTDPADDSAVSLDGTVNVLLAPVNGPDTRRSLDPAMFRKRPG